MPSSEDRMIGEKTGKVLVSVWDQAMTSLAQARAIRGEAAGNTAAFALWVHDILAIEVGAESLTKKLQVWYDSLDDLSKPGSEGHAGIEGLHRSPGEPKKLYKSLAEELVARCQRIPAEGES